MQSSAAYFGIPSQNLFHSGRCFSVLAFENPPTTTCSQQCVSLSLLKSSHWAVSSFHSLFLFSCQQVRRIRYWNVQWKTYWSDRSIFLFRGISFPFPSLVKSSVNMESTFEAACTIQFPEQERHVAWHLLTVHQHFAAVDLQLKKTRKEYV